MIRKAPKILGWTSGAQEGGKLPPMAISYGKNSLGGKPQAPPSILQHLEAYGVTKTFLKVNLHMNMTKSSQASVTPPIPRNMYFGPKRAGVRELLGSIK